jgi:hypothetical protein
MAGPGSAPNPMIGYAITAAIIAVVLIIRFRRINQERRLELGRLWIVPALYAVLAATMFVTTPPGETGWLLCAAGLAVGAPLGWLRGRMMHIRVDPETRALSLRQSPAAFLFILVLIVARSGSRAALAGGAGGPLHLSTAALADLLVGLALGLFAMQRLEMYLRARRLLAEAGAA